MSATQAHATPANTTDRPEYLHDTELGTLVCWFEYEAAEPETNSPPVCNLVNAWLGDLDLAQRLPGFAVKAIEHAALDCFETCEEDA